MTVEVYGRSPLEIWIDEAVKAERHSGQWTQAWRQCPGGAQFHREYVNACKRHAVQWAEIAEFAFNEAARMEADSSYSPDGERLMAMWYRATR